MFIQCTTTIVSHNVATSVLLPGTQTICTNNTKSHNIAIYTWERQMINISIQSLALQKQ